MTLIHAHALLAFEKIWSSWRFWGYGWFQKKISWRLIWREKILARKYVAKKIPTLKKLAYNDGKKILTPLYVRKKYFFTIGLGKKFLHKQNHTYTPLYSLQESTKNGWKKYREDWFQVKKILARKYLAKKNRIWGNWRIIPGKNILHLCKSGKMFFHHRFGKKNSYTNKSPIHPSKVKWSAN